MFKITSNRADAHSVTLSLAGKITVIALGEVRRAVQEATGEDLRVRLDLGEVTLVDRHSVEFLATQPTEGVELVNTPVYLQRWLTPGAVQGVRA